MTTPATKIIDAIKSADKPIICMDSRPDYDAICACVILHNYITQTLGKELYVSFDGVLPIPIKTITSKYADVSFMKENICPATDIDFSQYDLHIFLDSGDINHICKDSEFTPKTDIIKINIDHHAGNPLFGNLNYVKPLASACSAIYYLFKEAGVEINPSLASIYYLGVLLDSGFFQYVTTTSEDFSMVAELVKLGAKTHEINWKLASNERLHDMRLRGLVYSNLKVNSELKVAYSTITLKELEERNIDLNQTSAHPSDMIKNLENMKFVFVLRQSENDSEIYNVSFRSHDLDVEVLTLAQHFGGGGHKRAAGGTLRALNMENAVAVLIEYIGIIIK